MLSRVGPLLNWLASLRLTLLAMLLLGAGIILCYRLDWLARDWVALALGLLALNLLAAILRRPQFRRQNGLLVFHLGLLLIAVLAGLSILTRLQGRVELVEGQAFDPSQVVIDSQGWWLLESLDAVHFVQGPIRVQFHPGLRRGATRSEIVLPDISDQAAHRVVVGDTQALRLHGYRFVSTSNKGYAVLLDWIDSSGRALTGAVHMPSFPLQEWNQVNHWTTPTGQLLELELELARLQTDRDWILHSAVPGPTLHLQSEDGKRYTLQSGETVQLNGGDLRYEGIRLWLGYQIDYNPLLPWMFVAAMTGLAGLGWHFWGKYSVNASQGKRQKKPLSSNARQQPC